MVSRLDRIRRGAGAFVIDNGFRLLARAGKLYLRARREWENVEVIQDVPYQRTGMREHTLDIYLPATGEGPFPTVLYIHGGGFRILSKDTHWIMGLLFARRGYAVFNINYRLAPRHPFPAALDDASHAYRWVLDNAHRFAADPSRLVVSGESAGANLALALSICASYEREEPWARRVFESGRVPDAVVAMCGMLQVTNPQRFTDVRPFVRDRLQEVGDAYVGRSELEGEFLALADPLLVLEKGGTPARPLPPFFASVGTRDPLITDTQRLGAALEALNVRCETRFAEGEPHAFQAFLWREKARSIWKETFAFLDEVL